MYVVELFSFNASTALLSDVSLVTPTLNYFKKLDGCKSVKYGYLIEQKTRFMIIISWVSYAHYERSLQREDYNSFITSLSTSLPSSLQIQVGEFEKDPTEMLSAPVTDISTLTIETGASLEAVDAVFLYMDNSTVKVKVVEDPTHKYPTKIIRGILRNEPDRYLLFCGWISREKHREYVKKVTGIDEEQLNVKKIISIIEELDIRHVALSSA